MPFFQKLPVVIEAREFDGSAQSAHELHSWVAGGVGALLHQSGKYCITIETLEGQHRANPGDWIIRGVKGEFYPCKPDIFAQTYMPVPAPKGA